MLTRKLLNQGFLLVKLEVIASKVSLMTTDMFHFSKHFPVLSSFITFHRVCNYINTTGATH